MELKQDFFEPDCEHKDKCSSKDSGIKCGSCKHNNKKKDYYEPDRPYYTPFPGPLYKPFVEPSVTPRRPPGWREIWY